jgi:putative adhesin
MSNQEMQFADPDWKPSQQLDPKTSPGEREAYNPQPINTDYREQNQWRAAPPAPTQQEGYTGLRPYDGPPPQQMQGGNYRQRQYRRRGRGPWFWIILAIIIVSLMSGGFNRFGNNHVLEKQEYAVTGRPTIIINDTNGNIQVNVGATSNNVIIQADKESSFFSNANGIQADIHQDSTNLIRATVPDGQQGSVDFTVTIPQGADLQLQTISGDINVTGVDGQMSLTAISGNINASNDVINGSSSLNTTSGDITAKQTTLSEPATISTTSGDINFNGTIGTNGTYQFQSTSGNVDLTVPSTPPFSFNASTTSGTINSDYTSVIVQSTPPGPGAKATGDVGGSSSQPGVKLIINTISGDINLHQG